MKKNRDRKDLQNILEIHSQAEYSLPNGRNGFVIETREMAKYIYQCGYRKTQKNKRSNRASKAGD